MKFFDLHNDILTSGLPREHIIKENENYRNMGVNVINALWTSKLSSAEIATTLEFATDSGLVYAIEDCGSIDYRNFGERRRSPVYCSLTWNHDNRYAGGAHGCSGLTDDGRKLVEALNAAGIVVDVSHLNERSFYDVTSIADRVIASHSALYEVLNHPRNLNDRQIDAIMKKGGIVGITPVSAFIPDGDVNGFCVALKYVIGKFGYENFAIGSDFFGTKPLSGLDNYPKVVMVVYDYLSHEFNADAANAVLYGNAMRYFQFDNFVDSER